MQCRVAQRAPVIVAFDGVLQGGRAAVAVVLPQVPTATPAAGSGSRQAISIYVTGNMPNPLGCSETVYIVTPRPAGLFSHRRPGGGGGGAYAPWWGRGGQTLPSNCPDCGY